MIGWYYLIALSAILNAAVSIIQKRALRAEHATQYSLTSSFLLAMACVIFLPFANFDITPLQLLLAILFGALASMTLLLSVKVMRHGNISSVTPLANVFPILFTITLAYIFLAEKLTLIQVVCVLGIAAVTYLLLFRKRKNPFRRDFDSNKYKTILVATALIGSAGSIVGKYLLVNINVFTFLIITQITAATCLWIFNRFKYGGAKGVVWTLRTHWLTFIILVLLITSLRILSYFALTVAPINLAGTLSNAIFVMLTVPIGGVMFGEGDVRRKVLMSGAIMAFAYLLLAQ
ncbi:MAG: EamA family transporter [Candidatus Micrarchaeota archaeon]|nr:EamA family transporter [Candidatus Micrarchaeota archaeon]